MEEKQCKKCGKFLPATLEYFYKDTRHKEQFRSPCKECCKKIVDQEEKAKYRKQYYQKNKEILIEYQKIYRVEHKDKVINYRRKNKDKLTQKHREYVQNNLEEVYSYNRTWEIKNREKRNIQARAHDAKRRAYKKNSTGQHTRDDILNQYERQKGKCYWCSKKVYNNYHVDHIVPLSRGGSNDKYNIVISCPHCNEVKNSKLPHEWSECGRLL